MPGLQSLKAFISQRLTEAVDDILGHLERTFREYEEETERLVQPTDFQQLLARKEDQDQEAPELPHIKEEQEELWSSQESDITKFTFRPVKSEDDEEKPQSSQLHHSHTEENRDSVEEPKPDLQPEDRTSDSLQMDTSDCDWSGLNSVSDMFSCNICGKRFSLKLNLKLHMRAHTQATQIRHQQDTQFGEHKRTTESSQDVERTDGDNCGGSEPTGRSDPVGRLHPGPAVSAEPQSGTVTDTTDRKPLSCLDCGRRFATNRHLKTHMRCHIRDKPFSCWVCKKAFLWSGLLKKHMRTHTHLSKTIIQTGDKVVEVSPAQPEHLDQLLEKNAAPALQKPMTSSQFPRPIMPKVPVNSPLMAMPPVPAPFITPKILAPAGQPVRLLRAILPMPGGPDTNTGTEVASERRHYRRTVAANTCRKCGQFRTADTGHSQYRGRVYCPRSESLPKHQWLQVMRVKHSKS